MLVGRVAAVAPPLLAVHGLAEVCRRLARNPADREGARMSGFNERYSDVGNARWLVRLADNSIRFDRDRGVWLFNVGTHWTEDVDGEIERLAKKACDAMFRGLEELPLKLREPRFKHALRSEQAPRLRAMIDLARSEPDITIANATLDANPMVLGVRGGAIDLRNGDFFVPTASDFITRRAGCEYNPRAEAPTWNAFLIRIMNDDSRMIDFLRRAVGYSLSGDTSEQCLFVAHGVGANGKSVFLRAIRTLAGDYGADTMMSTFVDRRTDAASNDLARLSGIRFVSAAEAEEGRRMAEGLIKALTGGEAIAARFLFREYFEFVPRFKVWLGVNHRPSIRGDDHGIWRRIRLIPFPVTIPPEEQDRDLPAKLQRELPGILNWAIDGALEWRQEGLRPPSVVTDATEAYREEQDRVGQWITERCTVIAGITGAASALFKDYTTWSEERGERPLSMTAFGRRLGDRGYQKGKSGTVRYSGIGLADHGRLDGSRQIPVLTHERASRGYL